MLWFLFFLITIVFLESAVFSWIWGLFGSWLTIGGIFASAVTGGAIIRQQGLMVIRRLRDKSRGTPLLGMEFIDSICICIAGTALIIPGFLTDFLGTLFLIGPLRLFVGAYVFQKNKNIKPARSEPVVDPPPTIEGEFHEINNSKLTK